MYKSKFKFAMKWNSDRSQQFKSSLYDKVKIYLPGCLFLLAAYLIFRSFDIGMYELTADPAELAKMPPYAGFFSQIGCLLWFGSATICLFTAFFTKLDQSTDRRWFIFLIASFVLTISLLIDDMFQFHEYYAGIFVGFSNVPLKNHQLQNLFEIVYMFVMYFLSLTIYVFYFKQHLKDTEHIYLVVAIFLFGLSIAIDMLEHISLVKSRYFLEDGTKLLGIYSWLAYFYKTCSWIIRQLIAKLSL